MFFCYHCQRLLPSITDPIRIQKMLKIYNSLSNQKETFTPITENKINMYVCGMTVYDFCHLGHARVMVAFDVVYRYLIAKGYDVTYVRNITDIDDKIIQRANENGEEFNQLTERFIDAMHEDEKALGIHPPTFEPKATDNIEAIIDMITTLINKGMHIKGLQTMNCAKEGEPYWDSPWGKGRPGWHIECSAMSTQILGNHFDIHGGGHDLQFPHHENEIAQSEACTGEHFANYWMHNGFIRIDEEKMSKSLNNFFTIRDVLKDYKAEVIRYFMLTSQYRSPLNYSTDQLDAAHAALDRFYTALRGLDLSSAKATSEQAKTSYEERFEEAMDDDFNTPEALSVLFELAREVNRARQSEDESEAIKLAQSLLKLNISAWTTYWKH
ncbi:Cysteine--tRNA ligase [Nymphon striatum]|nr:Cysteine--tRNA ligase [Nymphon striatum]